MASARRCAPVLVASVKQVERLPPAQRALAASQALAEGCPQVLGPLAEGAALVRSSLDRAAQDAALERLALAHLPGGCGTGPCAPVGALHLDAAAARDAGRGAVLWAAAVRRALEDADAWDPAADRLVESWVLGRALQTAQAH